MQHPFVLICILAHSFTTSAENSFDARIVDHVGLDYACNGEVRPVLMIVNDGLIAMSGCVVETWKNGLMVSSFDWQLPFPAATGEIRRPSFPEVGDVVPGDLIEMRIISVNGVPDEEAEGNVLAFQVQADPPVSDSFVVEIRTQPSDSPAEVSWVIVDRSASAIASGGPYAVSAGEEVSAWVELNASECYSLVVNDSGGDGFLGGRVELVSEGAVVIIAEGADVVDELRSGFTTGVISSVPSDQRSAELAIYPVPASGSFFVETGSLTSGPTALELFDASGRVVDRVLFHAGLGRRSIDISGLQEGPYFVIVMDAQGGRFRSKLVVAN